MIQRVRHLCGFLQVQAKRLEDELPFKLHLLLTTPSENIPTVLAQRVSINGEGCHLAEVEDGAKAVIFGIVGFHYPTESHRSGVYVSPNLQSSGYFYPTSA